MMQVSYTNGSFYSSFVFDRTLWFPHKSLEIKIEYIRIEHKNKIALVQSIKFSNHITFQMDTSTYIALVYQAMLHMEDEWRGAPLNQRILEEIFFPIYN